MSVWQEFLIGLAYVYPETPNEVEVTNLVYKLFKILLHHAIKYEYGGWRVWIDTLSILHSRVSKEEYQLKMNKLYEDYERSKESSQQDWSLNGAESTGQDNDEELKQKNDQRSTFFRELSFFFILV